MIELGEKKIIDHVGRNSSSGCFQEITFAKYSNKKGEKFQIVEMSNGKITYCKYFDDYEKAQAKWKSMCESWVKAPVHA
jgi:hypothetical protein